MKVILTGSNMKDNVNRIMKSLANYPKTVQEVCTDCAMSRVVVYKILKKLYSEQRVKKFYRLESRHKLHVYSLQGDNHES